MKRLDITNQRFGKLTTISLAGHTKRGDLLWLCKCDCGNEKLVPIDHLRRGLVKSCGCLRKKPDFVGERFGKLTVISSAGNSKNGSFLWLCKCDCGNEKLAQTGDLRGGKLKSCGCLKTKPSIAGERFGKLTVIESVREGFNRTMWRCICDCGKENIVHRSGLVSGRIRSCGCLRVERLEGQRFGRLTVVEEVGRTQEKDVLWKCLCDCGNEKLATTGYLRYGSVQSCGCLGIEARKKGVAEQIMKNCVEGTSLLALSNKPYIGNTSGIRGVYYDKGNKKWNASIQFKKKIYRLGSYASLEAAAEARREAEEMLFDPILKKYGRNKTSEEDYQERLKAAIERQGKKH